MIITVKILQGRECTIEVIATETIGCVKRLVAKELDIPVDQQRLVFQGKTLSDGHSLVDYNIIDGTKLHLVVKRTDSPLHEHNRENQILWDELKKFLLKHFKDVDARHVTDHFKKDFEKTLSSLSLDDIERIARANIEAQHNMVASTSHS